MEKPTQPQGPQYSGTYFVQDRQSEEELQRLANQDRLVTASMGGILAEQAEPGTFGRVLDIACGSGGWALEAAQTYPEMELVGIDVNPRMIEYAHAQAAAPYLDERVTFHTMDALQVLDFPDNSFDLVNMRFGLSFLRTWDWPRLLNELRRILRPGGVVRLTDEEVVHQSTSPAAMHFCELLLCALFRSGHLFTQESTGLTAHLAPLLTQHGFQQVQTRAHVLHYEAGTSKGQRYIEDGVSVLRTLQPFLEKWGCAGKDYQDIRQQAVEEIHRPDFSANWHLLTAWGMKPNQESR